MLIIHIFNKPFMAQLYFNMPLINIIKMGLTFGDFKYRQLAGIKENINVRQGNYFGCILASYLKIGNCTKHPLVVANDTLSIN